MQSRTIPSFDDAKNRRQKVRAAGLNPNHWYPVEYSNRLATGGVQDVVFWGKSMAIFRGEDAKVRCVENRCAHRQLKLTTGHIRGCQIVCPYHGWSYDGEGHLVDIPHEMFGKPLPKLQLPNYAVRERYELIWVFPGDQALAETTKMPEIPELEGSDPWACVPIDAVWRAHHSMIMDNVCDFTHAYLHRKTEPFRNAKLLRVETEGDRILVDYETQVAAGPLMKHFIDRKTPTDAMRLCYDYPYQWSNTGDWYRHWCFLLPIDERTTRVFFLFYYRSLKVPGLPLLIPRRLMQPMLKIGNRLIMEPILDEDRVAVEAEQDGYERNYDAPIAEISPVVHEFQALTIRKWEAYLAEKDSQPIARRLPMIPSCAS